jgi:predicted dithiol-disulfide oxidoreductase (DUF899 family)
MKSQGKVSVPTSNGRETHPVVSHKAWLAARTELLKKEKAFTRQRDKLSRQRRKLPWEKVDKQYVFDTPDGKQTLADLFGKRSQLVVYHFMFPAEWEEGCKHCSFWADHFDAMGAHLNHRDVSFAAISRAPLSKLEAFKKRMGWHFKWVSSGGNDFNYDFQVSFRPQEIESGSVVYNYKKTRMDMTDREGASVFYKEPSGGVFHTYSTYARGIDMLNNTYQFLDLVPKGRDEDGLEFTQAWVQFHDSYSD